MKRRKGMWWLGIFAVICVTFLGSGCAVGNRWNSKREYSGIESKMWSNGEFFRQQMKEASEAAGQFLNHLSVKPGWNEIRGSWYYADEKGNLKTGPFSDNGVLYYLEEDGKMAVDTGKIIGGVSYQFDSSGQGKADWPYKYPLFVPPESEKTEFHKSVDQMADAVLDEILTEDMGERERAEAIWHWIRENLRYNGYSPVGDWVKAAYDGLRKRRGDCYTYYATSAELLPGQEFL